MNKLRILFAEDDHVLNMATSEALEELGFSVESVYSASAAIEAIDRLEYITALLTDIDLGVGLDGFDVARHARVLYRDLPVVYVSGSKAAHHAAHGVPGSLFVGKPFQQSQIGEALGRVIRHEAA
jgi:CheY-like chemotaxis protein